MIRTNIEYVVRTVEDEEEAQSVLGDLVKQDSSTLEVERIMIFAGNWGTI